MLETLRSQPQYAQFRTFWEHGSAPSEPSALFNYAPYFSGRAFEESWCPFRQTITLQRVTTPRFRREMVFALGLAKDHAEGRRLASFETWATLTPQNFALAEKFRHASGLPLLQRCLLARVLCALGFFEESLSLVPPRIDSSHFDLAEAYAFATRLFLMELKPNPPDIIRKLLRSGFGRIPDQEETLRTRLTVTMFACVYAGNHRLVDDCRYWRASGETLLNVLRKRQVLSAFETELLTSRFYRAASYVPFLERDPERLAADAQIIESTARGLQPTDHKERILTRENLYPMLETCSRIHHSLRNFDRSFDLMAEIARDVDPLDCKAWLQAGEVHARLGRIELALQAFEKAGANGLPMGRIAWFKAGRACEKLGRNLRAIEYYERSLRAWPNAPSPTARLHALSEAR